MIEFPKHDSLRALEKFDMAVEDLRYSPGSLGVRLLEAMQNLSAVGPEEIPPVLRQDYQSLRQRLTRDDAHANEGRIAATIRNMSDQELWDAGVALLNLHDSLRALLGVGKASRDLN
jgi:hypothetical protein